MNKSNISKEISVLYDTHMKNNKRKLINGESNFHSNGYSYPIRYNKNSEVTNFTKKCNTRKLFNIDSKCSILCDDLFCRGTKSTETSSTDVNSNVNSPRKYMKIKHTKGHNADEIPCKVSYLNEPVCKNQDSLFNIPENDVNKDGVHTTDVSKNIALHQIVSNYQVPHFDGHMSSCTREKIHKQHQYNKTINSRPVAAPKDKDSDHLSHFDKSIFDSVQKNKHKYIKVNNISTNALNEDQISNHDILCLNGSSDGQFKKKHKRRKKDRESSKVTTTYNLKVGIVDQFKNISEKHINDPVSNDILKRKHKKHKNLEINSSIGALNDTDNVQITNSYNFNKTDSLEKYKKHKKSKNSNSIKTSEGEHVDQISNSHDIPYFNQPVLDGQFKKQHKKNKENISGITADNLKDKSVDYNTDIYEEQHLEDPVFDSKLKKKSKKHKIVEINPLSSPGGLRHMDITQIPNSDVLHPKKHKKHKKSKNSISIKTSEGEDDDQTSNSHDIPYLNQPVLDGQFKKKHKKAKENIAADNLKDKIADIYEAQDLVSNGMLKKKSKTHKILEIISSSNNGPLRDTDIAHIPNSYEQLYFGESISDVLDTKKHNKYKKKKDNNSIKSSESEHVDQISNSHDIQCLNQPVLDGKFKKKHKKVKNIAEITVDNLKDKTVDYITDIYEGQYLEDFGFDGKLKKKSKKHKFEETNSSNGTGASSNTDIAQIQNSYEQLGLGELISDAVTSQKNKKHRSSKRSKSTNNLGDGYDEISNDICLNDSFSDSNLKKRHKNNSRTTTDKSKNKTVNEILDIYEEQYVDDPNFDGIVKKKLKKCKIKEINSFNSGAVGDSDIVQVPSSHKLPNFDESVCDPSYKKKRRGNKDSNLSNIINIFEDEDVLIPNNMSYASKVTGINQSHQDSFEMAKGVSNIIEHLKKDYSDLNFNDEPVDFEVSLLHVYETVRALSNTQKKELISQGIVIKTGKFTHDEDAVILRNFEEFAKSYGTLDICEMLGIGKEAIDNNISKFLKAKHFYVRLGKGLGDRTLNSIYKRARLLLHPYKIKCKFDETEVRSLKSLHSRVNNKWNYIGDILERTGANCLEAYRWHEKGISRGKWTKEEEQQLIAGIKKVTGSSDLSYDKIKGISWNEVASHVPTRNFSQCRMYWADHLAWKPGASKQKWNKSCHEKLISILRKEWYVENTSEIDWLKVHKSFEDVAPSHIFLQKRWLYLKSLIQRFKTMSYKEIINALCKKYNITFDESYSAPFSSSARNQRLSHNLEVMRNSIDNIRNRIIDVS